MLTLTLLAEVLRAAAAKAEELAAAEGAAAENREAERGRQRRQRAEADVAAVVYAVRNHPGVALGPLRSALVSAGLSAERAALAVNAAILSGAVLASGGPRSRAHCLPSAADCGEVVP